MFNCKVLPIQTASFQKNRRRGNTSADFIKVWVMPWPYIATQQCRPGRNKHHLYVILQLLWKKEMQCLATPSQELTWLQIWEEYGNTYTAIATVQKKQQQQRECWSQQCYWVFSAGTIWLKKESVHKLQKKNNTCTKIKKQKNINQVTQHSLGQSLQI